MTRTNESGTTEEEIKKEAGVVAAALIAGIILIAFVLYQLGFIE